MTPTEISNMQDEEVSALIAALKQTLAAREAARQQKADELKEGIANAVEVLENLIGPNAPTVPSLNSITEARLFTGAQMKAGSELALPLLFTGMEILARVTLDIAEHLAGREQA